MRNCTCDVIGAIRKYGVVDEVIVAFAFVYMVEP